MSDEGIELSFEQDGIRRFLVVKDGTFTAKTRIPLHVWNMSDGDLKNWHMTPFVKRLKKRLFQKRKICQAKK